MNQLETVDIFGGKLHGTILGPAKYSQVFDPRCNELLDQVEFEVSNGSRVIEPLPFGMFADVEKNNPNHSLLKLRFVKGYAAGGATFFPLNGSQIDPRYGVMFHYTTQVVPAGTQGTITTASGAIIGSEVQPMDPAHSTQISARLNALPADQVWYGKRRENLPDVLLALVVAGSEQWYATPQWKCAPDGPLKARFTRKFSYGPPADFDPSNAYRPWTTEPVQYFAEYLRTSVSDTTSISTSVSQGVHNGTNISSSQNTSEGTSQTTSDSESNSDSRSTTNSTNSGNSSSTSTNTSSGTSSSNSIGTSTTFSYSSGYNFSTSSSSGMSSGTSFSSGTNSSQTTNSGTSFGNAQGQSSSLSTSLGTGRTNSDSASADSTATSDSGAPMGSSSVARSTQSYSNSGSSHQGQTQNDTISSSSSNGSNSSNSSSSGNSSSTGSSSNSSTNQSSGNSQSSGNNSSSGQNQSTNISDSTSRSTNSSEGNSTSTNTSTSDGVSYSHNVSSGTSTSKNSSVSNSSGASSGTSNSTNQGTSQSHTTSIGQSLFSLTIPKCLHGALAIPLPDGGVVNIPATVPANLPWGNYLEVSRNSEHWKNGVWVTELIEVYLPA